jgi:hypothetical protein
MGAGRFAVALSVLAVALVMPAVVHADRKPTSKERAQIAAVVQLPAKCARVRVSTVTKKPKWATAEWRDGGQQCSPFASNGVTVEKKRAGRWRFITAGSSFDCPGLYAKVPQPVAKDLRISCT